MAASAWAVYDKFPLRMGDGTIDMDADTFKVALHTSASNAATLSTEGHGSVTSEHANANGYTTGGATLGSITFTESAGVITFDAADPSWTASGGSIVARFAVIYDDTVVTPTADTNVAYSLLDTTPADVTVTDGNTLTLQLNASGIFTIS